MKNRQYIAMFAVLTIGMVIGALLTGQSDIDATDSILDSNPGTSATRPPGDENRIAALESELSKLRGRLVALESLQRTEGLFNAGLDSEFSSELDPELNPELNPALAQLETGQESRNGFVSRRNFRGNSGSQTPIVDGLVLAGMDVFTATEIARNQSQVELARMELRDQAIRDGYIGGEQYREEMRELRSSEVQLADEVGEETYDRYLFHTGQPNRIAVQSVLMGSAAEGIGIQGGDVVLSYEGERVYNTRDLRSAIAEGNRDEIVDVSVLRDGSTITLSIPRGPLGVRLEPVSVDPETETGP